MPDRTAVLADAGFQIDPRNDPLASVLDTLTDAELKVLVSVRARLSASAPDLEGHMTSGGWCW